MIEEKGPVVEQQIKDLLYNRPTARGRASSASTPQDGAPLLSALGELRPSRMMPVVADWLARHKPALDRRHLRRRLSSRRSAARTRPTRVKRLPYFCSGCPHNTSTKVPEGSRAQAGIGCHFMASWMERDTTGLIQMGGEGVDWVSHSMFTKTPHVFQNLGDGTYYHSGYLAIRQAIAAKANITYKILYQRRRRDDRRPAGRRQHLGAADRAPGRGRRRDAASSSSATTSRSTTATTTSFRTAPTFHHRDELDAVQRALREIDGRDRPDLRPDLRGREAPAPQERRVSRSGQASLHQRGRLRRLRRLRRAVELPRRSCRSKPSSGRKRHIDQSSCNKDYSCVNGFCPSFVTRRRREAEEGRAAPRSIRRARARASTRCRCPRTHLDRAVRHAGHRRRRHRRRHGRRADQRWPRTSKARARRCSTSWASRRRAARCCRSCASPRRDERLNQVRIDTQQADVLLACDMVVGASADALQTVRHGRTRDRRQHARDPDRDASCRIRTRTCTPTRCSTRCVTPPAPSACRRCDAQALATSFLGDTIVANILMLGYAWQRGLVPVSLAAMMRAIELNNVAVR